jgi:hypothetical protein
MRVTYHFLLFNLYGFSAASVASMHAMDDSPIRPKCHTTPLGSGSASLGATLDAELDSQLDASVALAVV